MTNQALSSETESYLVRFAQRLTTDSQFMASVLNRYREQEGLGELALADLLGISSAMYTRLALCKRPTADRHNFADQVKRIAAYVGCDAAQLAQMINQVDALGAIRPVAAEDSSQESLSQPIAARLGWLAAARDRTEIDQNTNEEMDRSEESDASKPEQAP
jgi:transcriptional regulator with XRE-family HTH domain